jgi:dTDP-glucose 4,6-dehydratase
MENILVTGGAGFIGANFVDYALKINADIEIYNLDALTYAGNTANLSRLIDPSRHHFIHGDIQDTHLLKEILEQHEITRIVHFAAETHVDRSLSEPEKFIATNVWGTVSLLTAALETWKKKEILKEPGVRFHHISTDEVYGELQPGDPPFNENTPYSPNSPYSASKAASDHFVRAFHHSFGLPVTITNCSNNYGPYQYPEKLIPLMILNALQQKPLPVYGAGAQIRDWLYVTDHCDAIWTVLTRGKVGETYCIGGEEQPSNLQVVQAICGIMEELHPVTGRKYADLITFVTDRPGHDFRYAIDISKIQQELGWFPKTSLQAGLWNTVSWYLENPEWIGQVTGKPDYADWIKTNYSKQRTVK